MQKIEDIFEYLIGILDNLVYLLIGLALLGFLWGVFKYIKSANDPKALDEAKKYIVYGLLSLLIITSLWSFVFLLGRTFGVEIDSSNSLRGDDVGDSFNDDNNLFSA